MGYGSYERPDGRLGGYNVRGECNEPGCGVLIDHGLAYLCGREIGDEAHEWGCGNYFCSHHQFFSYTDDSGMLCTLCLAHQNSVLVANAQRMYELCKQLLPLTVDPADPETERGRKYEWAKQLLANLEDLHPDDLPRQLDDDAGDLWGALSVLTEWVPGDPFSNDVVNEVRDLRLGMLETSNERRHEEQSKRGFPVTITFLTSEPVTPDLFAQKVAMACSSGCLRPGESVLLPSDSSKRYVVQEGSMIDELREAGLPL